MITKELEQLSDAYDATELREQRRDLAFLRVSPERLLDLLHRLQREGYGHLVFLTCVDIIGKETFRLIYMVHNNEARHDIGVEVDIDRNNPVMESIHTFWAQAATYQRELKEMYGIDFPGSPGVDEPFILEGWEDLPPMRRDFDTKAYSEATYVPREGRFTVSGREKMKAELYPEPEGEGA